MYVLTGPQTFSNKPSAQTGASLFKLPRTKLIVSLSYLYMERPDTSKNHEDALYPDIPVKRTLAKVREGHDEAFEWILTSGRS